MISVQTVRPHPRLEPFVRSYVYRETDATHTIVVEPVVARLGTMLEFQFARPYDIPLLGTPISLVCPRVAIIGPVTGCRVQLMIRDQVEALTVLFTPLGFAALFGIPTSLITDMGIEAHSLLGGGVSALGERLENSSSFSERVRLLNLFLCDQLDRSQPPKKLSRSFETFIAARTPLTVVEFGRASGLSPRQLERRTLEYCGVPPKLLGRIARYQRALRLKTTTSLSWTDIAHRTNYHDQMHLVRDFHAFTGESPTRALSQISPDHLISF